MDNTPNPENQNNSPAPENTTAAPETSVQPSLKIETTEKKTENLGNKLNLELKQAEDSLQDVYNRMPLSFAGIFGILFGFVGLFLLRLWFGLLAVGCAIIARKYQNDLAGFYLALALGIIDIVIFLTIWFLFHFTQAGFWL